MKTTKNKALVALFKAHIRTRDLFIESCRVAFKLGEKLGDPLSMYLSDIFTIPANLAGIPGISVPCGFTKKGLPIGLQILGKPFDEETVLRLGHAYEQLSLEH